MSTLVYANRLLREFDGRREVVEDVILNGTYETFEGYLAACATRRTWLAAREVVVASLDRGEDDVG